MYKTGPMYFSKHSALIFNCLLCYSFFLCYLDIDECNTGHDCQEICSNTLGGYKCSCNEGYQLTADNRTCTGVFSNQLSAKMKNLVTKNGTIHLARKCDHIYFMYVNYLL